MTLRGQSTCNFLKVSSRINFLRIIMNLKLYLIQPFRKSRHKSWMPEIHLKAVFFLFFFSHLKLRLTKMKRKLTTQFLGFRMFMDIQK